MYRQRFEFLTGLRGLAALYVVFFHAWLTITFGVEPNDLMRLFLGWAAAGTPAVAVFIVLSGFLLSLPVTDSGHLPGGLRGFARRRARRILPPYLAALTLSAVVVLGISPELFRDPAGYARLFWPVEPALNFMLHLLLIHNLFPPFSYGFNGPLWSVATEWQIYIVFALLLVPLRRHWGPLGAFAAGIVLAIVAVLASMRGFATAGELWLIGAFALGSLAAEIAQGAYHDWFARGPWSTIAILSWAITAVWIGFTATGHEGEGDSARHRVIFACTMVALGTSATILAILRGDAGFHLLGRLLSSRPLNLLGVFSYSLYLTHGPVIAGGDAWLRQEGLSVTTRFTVLLMGWVPAALIVAYVFYRFFERPTLKTTQADCRRVSDSPGSTAFSKRDQASGTT